MCVHKVCICIGAQNSKVKTSHLTKAFISFVLVRAQDPVTAERTTEGSGGKKKKGTHAKERQIKIKRQGDSKRETEKNRGTDSMDR